MSVPQSQREQVLICEVLTILQGKTLTEETTIPVVLVTAASVHQNTLQPQDDITFVCFLLSGKTVCLSGLMILLNPSWPSLFIKCTIL